MGRSEFNTVRSLLRLILVHLVKTSSDPDAEAVAHWASEIRNWHFQFLDGISPAMKSRIDLDHICVRRFARPRPTCWLSGGKIKLTGSGTALDRRVCPIGLETLCDPGFEFLAELLPHCLPTPALPV